MNFFLIKSYVCKSSIQTDYLPSFDWESFLKFNEVECVTKWEDEVYFGMSSAGALLI